jgi:cation transport protein ChaC
MRDCSLGSDLWVFAYGSLMWRPGFASEEALPATLAGYRRCFCIYSVHHRGSPERPGLVLGLDRGGNCRGVAYRVAAADAAPVLAYLTAREQINGVYRAARVPVTLADGGRVDAIAFIAERVHPSYAGALPIATQARLIRAARGSSGTNLEYLASTLEHLAERGVRERELDRVAVAAGAVLVRGGTAGRSLRLPGLVGALRATAVDAPVMRPGDRRRFVHRLA